MLVTALRDGMNLVAKEYVATRTDDDGVLVLSEFAGAADELRTALLVNPHDIDGLKDAMVQAATMPKRERQKRMRAMRKRVFEHDVTRWSDSFLDELRRTHDRVDGPAADAEPAAPLEPVPVDPGDAELIVADDLAGNDLGDGLAGEGPESALS
jgi:trehalose 6-phosphate synthase